MKRVTISVPSDTRKRMLAYSKKNPRINWSAIATRAIEEAMSSGEYHFNGALEPELESQLLTIIKKAYQDLTSKKTKCPECKSESCYFTCSVG